MQPMLATAGPLPTGPGWAYEFKWDGVRTLADVSVGDLFYGMAIPGLIMGGLYLAYIFTLCSFAPGNGPRIPDRLSLQL